MTTKVGSSDRNKRAAAMTDRYTVEHTNGLEQALARERQLSAFLADHNARLFRQVQTLQAALTLALTAREGR